MGKEIFIAAVARARSFDQGNYLAGFLAEVESLSPNQEEFLVDAFNRNNQVHDAFDFRPAFANHLKRMTGNDYEIRDGRMVRLPESLDDLPFQ